MKKIAIDVSVSKIFCGEPLSFAPHFDFARHVCRARLSGCVLYLNICTGDGLAQGAALDFKIFGARVADQNDTDFGCAIHAADAQAKGLFDKVFGGAVDRFAGKRHFC